MARITPDLHSTPSAEAVRGNRYPRGGAAVFHLTILEETSEQKKRRWRSFLVSATCQLVCVLALTYLGILFNIIRPPETLQPIRAYVYIPQGPNPEPPLPPKAPPPPPKQPMDTAKMRVIPVPEKPKAILPPPPVVKPVLQPMNIPAPPPLRPPKPEVVQGTFTQAKTVEAPKRPQGQVTSASFGTPTAAPTGHASEKPVAVGGFGIGGTPQRGRLMLPQGGSIYHPVGFGDAAGGGGSGSGRKSGGGVQVGGSGFDNTLYASAGPNPSGARQPEAGPPTVPVEILFKPKPEYTEAARREKIEGEVLLQALFTATGQVTNIRVVQGLGYGLDEMALKAAQKIQFKAAQRNGVPVDSVASIRIVFKLAY